MKTSKDEILAQAIGSCMRFFLNATVLLATVFSLLLLLKMESLTISGLLIVSAPVVITLLFFIFFLSQIKRVEKQACKKRNIELVSRVIWEFNKSYLIRIALGKIAAFIEPDRN